MDQDKETGKPVSRRHVVRTTLFAALGGAGTTKAVDGIADLIVPKETQARVDILEWAKYRKVTSEYIATHIIATYEEALATLNADAISKARASEIAVKELEQGEFHISPDLSRTVIEKYEEKLANMPAESNKKAFIFGLIGTFAGIVAHWISSDPSSAMATPAQSASPAIPSSKDIGGS